MRATRLTASDPKTWKPVSYQAVSPSGGVTLDDAGLLKRAMERNVAYLLNSFSVNHMLVPFRERAGQRNPPDDKPQVAFWDTQLRGSNAGRFLMGVGNTLRWLEHPELRGRMDELVDGIESCRGEDGYILAYPPDRASGEEPNYARSWLTHGLIEAGLAGNPKAFALLRGHADWFNRWELLPRLIDCCIHAHQGHIASTRTFFTPIGRPEDLQVAEKYYVQDWWLVQLAARREEAVWRYPLPTPHCYLITSFEAYLDHYRATGDQQYLDAMLGAWELIRSNWEHVGGGIALCEHDFYPPNSRFITPRKHTGELCGSAFWIKFNQRFHLLFPMREEYMNEIEKSIYNVGLAALGDDGIRYHLSLDGWTSVSAGFNNSNTCCEGQGTRLYGSLPEYVYSVAEDGLFVNLFESSTIKWRHRGNEVGVRLTSGFPFHPDVSLRIATARPVAMNIRIRVPSWAASAMPIAVNGRRIAEGRPGSYQSIDRSWFDGDCIQFSLPFDMRLSPYTGFDKIPGHARYAIETGPLLLTAIGPKDFKGTLHLPCDPVDHKKWLKSVPGQPLHFIVEGASPYQYLPYFEFACEGKHRQYDDQYSCYPVIEPLAIKGDESFLDSNQIELSCVFPNAEIRYTLDGSEPCPLSAMYDGPFQIERTTSIKARPFSGDRPLATTIAETFVKVGIRIGAGERTSITTALSGEHVVVSMRSPFQELRILPRSGGRMAGWRLVKENRELITDGFVEMRGAVKDCFWVPVEDQQSVDAQPYEVVSGQAYDGAVVLTLRQKKLKPSRNNVVLTKTFRMREDQPGFEVEVTIENAGPTPVAVFAYWSHHVFHAAAAPEVYLETETGPTKAPETSICWTKPDQPFFPGYEEWERHRRNGITIGNWIGQYDPSNDSAVVCRVLTPDVAQFYSWRRADKREVSLEWMHPVTPLRVGGKWRAKYLFRYVMKVKKEPLASTLGNA